MIHVTDDGAVRTVTLDNPSQRNAILPDAWVPLRGAFAGFEESTARVMVIRGAGEDFCSGAGLAGETPEGLIDAYDLMAEVGAAARALHETTKPTVAAVDGVAAGAGMNLALGCDVLIATTRSRFSEVFVRRGLTIDFGGTWLLPRRVGLARAKELALTGRVIDAAEANRLGLVSRLVEPADFDDAVTEVVEELAAGAPLAQSFIKRGLSRSFSMTFDEALAYEAQAQSICIGSEDAAEGVAAFLDKRAPRFEGR